ncbi:MAG: MAPEG family protein, partial [Erythrobacter sp.]|nr:MAPEG family protein [Erythrobacter sp.]
FILILIAAIELAGHGTFWLAAVAGIYMLARVAHGIGMDGEGPTLLRKIGVIVTFVTQLFLAGFAVGIALAVV